MGEWITPTGGSDWTNNYMARDDSTSTRAYRSAAQGTWTGWIYLTHAALSCPKIRFWPFDPSWRFTIVNVQAFYNGDWQAVYSGGFTRDAWNEKVLGGYYDVTQIRLSFFNNSAGLETMRLAEVDFYEEEPPPPPSENKPIIPEMWNWN